MVSGKLSVVIVIHDRFLCFWVITGTSVFLTQNPVHSSAIYIMSFIADVFLTIFAIECSRKQETIQSSFHLVLSRG